MTYHFNQVLPSLIYVVVRAFYLRRRIILVLTRRLGETIIIGDNEIEVTILGIQGKQVRLGLKADESWTIHRKEIFDQIKAEEEGE